MAVTNRIAVVSLFPEMFTAVTEYGITGRAVSSGLIAVRAFNPRDYTSDRHQTVDARPYGGGPGMVMMIEPLRQAIEAARQWLGQGDGEDVEQGKTGEAGGAGAKPATRVIYLSPQGRVLDQRAVACLARQPRLVLVAGRYEGIDERLIELEVDEEWSIGDYVLSGGELPAMVLMDALIRQLPGALGHGESAAQDSFFDGLLDCPHYTRPENYQGMCVPEVLLSGNHERIRQWRRQQSLARTRQRRPDLLEAVAATGKEQADFNNDPRRPIAGENNNKLADDGGSESSR